MTNRQTISLEDGAKMFREWAERFGPTQREQAKAIGFSPSTMSNWATGYKVIHPDICKRMGLVRVIRTEKRKFAEGMIANTKRVVGYRRISNELR